jgi:hypothetical protein
VLNLLFRGGRGGGGRGRVGAARLLELVRHTQCLHDTLEALLWDGGCGKMGRGEHDALEQALEGGKG